MKITKEIYSFDELYEQSWSGAKDTLKIIKENDKEEDLMNFLETLVADLYENGIDETNLNDYLWFGYEEIFEILEIEEY